MQAHPLEGDGSLTLLPEGISLILEWSGFLLVLDSKFFRESFEPVELLW
jgi:hypothetical protein